MWVYNNEKENTQIAPVLINFRASKRPEGSPYAIVDTWNGYYETDHSMILTGSRCYVNENGKTNSTSLGTMAFNTSAIEE